MHDIPLNDTQRFFAEKNHNLGIYHLWICHRSFLSFLYSHHFFFDGNTGGERQRQRILSN